MANPMFVLDEHMVEMIFDYCRQRLALDPVPLDFGGARESFDEVLSGLIGESGNDPEAVLALFADHLATAVVSCDSPRFLAFIPAAPTKAALLFDMIVSCSSLQGTSWLEAAGAVAAENQVLEFLADLAGLPPGAGGCFVSGGSIANLSALVVARDTRVAAARGGTPRRPRIAVSEEAHASVDKALRILGVEPFVVPAVDHRLTGEALAGRARARRPIADDVDRRRGHGGHDQRGDRRRPGRHRRRGAPSAPCGSTSTPPTAGRAVHPARSATGTRASSTPTRSSSTPTSGSTPRSTAPPSSTASRAGQGGALPGGLVPRRHPRRRQPGVEPQ